MIDAPPPASCAKTFTVYMSERGIRATYRGTKNVTGPELGRVRRYIRCVRRPRRKPHLRAFWHARRAEWVIRRTAASHPFYTAVASVYDAAGGPIACGGDSYAYGVASRTLPCGTRLTICYRGCVNAIVFDRGPYVYSRDLDLSRAVQYAIGFPTGVGVVRYRLGP